jgi:hypothetical protein
MMFSPLYTNACPSLPALRLQTAGGASDRGFLKIEKTNNTYHPNMFFFRALFLEWHGDSYFAFEKV